MRLPRQQLKTLIGILIFIPLYGTAIVFATTYVAPGFTLDPSGGPGSYTVTPPISYGNSVTTGHNNEILYNDGSGNLSSDQYFTRTGVPIVDPTGVYLIANNTGASIQNTANNDVIIIGHTSDVTIDDNFDHTRTTGSLLGQVRHEGTGLVNSIIALAGQVLNDNSGNVETAVGVLGRISATSTGVITDAIAFLPQFAETNPNTITNSYIIKSSHNNFSGTNKYGVYIDEPGTINVLEELQLWQESPLKWYDSDSSNFVAFKSPATVASNMTWTLPGVDGSAGQYLKTDGSGNLSWDTPVGGGGSNIQTTKVSLSSAQILSLYTSPVELIPAPGVGKYIKVFGMSGKLNFGTLPYTSSTLNAYEVTNMGFPYTIYSIGSGMAQFLDSTVDTLQSFGEQSNGASALQLDSNVPLLLQATMSDPTGGDGTVDIYITYEIIDL